ncbi:MAG: 30S ribosomal protein S24e [Candidatus Hodarchaeales archaeon]|jgi:small subunit ribosomal protein S24e
MEIEITSERGNALLHRKEYTAVISHIAEATPSRLKTRDTLSALVNAEKDRTIVINIRSDFGGGRSKVEFRVYDTPEQLKQIELPYLLKRNDLISEES